MKKKISLIICIIVILAVLICLIYKLNENNSKNVISQNNNEVSLSKEESRILGDEVVIKNESIENEDLIDEFIENVQNKREEDQQLSINQDGKKIILKYHKPSDEKNLNQAETSEERQKAYGYYELIVDDKESGKFDILDHKIKRSVNQETNIVTLFVDAPLIEYAETPTICSYSLESSKYSKKFELEYHQRKDLGVKEVYDAGEYKVKTYGGDVTIIVDNNELSLNDALAQKVITPDDILNQANIDYKYGICDEDEFQDGGSKEFYYYADSSNQYTILKFNTISGNQDLVIGMAGSIINKVEE